MQTCFTPSFVQATFTHFTTFKFGQSPNTFKEGLGWLENMQSLVHSDKDA
jgi:hypothetical protein